MSTFDRWNKLAGLQNEAAEPQQLAESKQQPESSKQMNESQLREMISKVAKEILSERKARKDDIEYIQSILNSLLGDDTVDVDGILGRQTANAIAKFQGDAGLKADGIIGRKTYTAMASALDAKGIDSDFALGEMMSDVPVIGRRGLVDAPAPDKDIEMPVMNVTVDDSDKEDDFLSDEFLASLPEDPSFKDIAAAKGEEVADALVGEPVPGDEPTDLDVTLPGMPNTFLRGVQFTDVYGDRTLSISQEDYERAGSPDLDDIARANRVDKVEVSA